MIRIAWTASVLGLLFASGAASSEPQKPNVVVILADDLGWTDLGCYGSKYYETPHIDRLASEGMRFTSGYSCGPNCQPTRAAMASGQYCPRTGIYTVGSIERFNWRSRPLRPVDNVSDLALEKTTYAEALKQAEYVTGLFGKWHLGSGPYHPKHQGYDEAIVSMGRHFQFKTDPRADTSPEDYLADFLTDRAVEFIDEHHSEPFLLCVHHFAVHTPLEAKEPLIRHFREKPPADGHQNPTYAAMIASLDESVGRIIARLEELKLADKTLVIFTSDNGGVGGYDREGIQGGEITDNAPLRGGKGMLYEGGIRVPYIFRWSGRIAAGSICDVPINSVDLYPTLLELAGATPPENYPLDGTSYLELLLGGEASQRNALYWHFPGYLGAGGGTWRTTPASAVRIGDWKLMEFYEDGRLELYNLKEDRGEKSELSNRYPEKVKELHGRLARWREEIGARTPKPRTASDGDAPKSKARRRSSRVGE